jgi:hypothetical protein
VYSSTLYRYGTSDGSERGWAVAKKKTAQELAEDEARTTPTGMFYRAEAYWLSAMALKDAKVKHGHAHSPVRFLYYHAIELYLKAYLRHKGHTVEELSGPKFGHKTNRLSKRVEALGLAFDPHDTQLFTLMGDTDIVIRARYIRTGAATWPTFDSLNVTCSTLHEDIGKAMSRDGVRLRLTNHNF